VVYPGSEHEVVAIVDACVAADAVLIPYGGGSNIVGALEALPEERRQVVSINLGRMNKVLEIDENAGLARIQAGVLGPDMEIQLNAKGWTMGHFPDSFMWSTVGG
jgi:alkyldihydroxyacetonephosphate synthase